MSHSNTPAGYVSPPVRDRVIESKPPCPCCNGKAWDVHGNCRICKIAPGIRQGYIASGEEPDIIEWMGRAAPDAAGHTRKRRSA